MKVSVIVPCYNEEHNIVPFAQELQKVMEDSNLSWEVIFINDGSGDGTLPALKKLCAEKLFPTTVVSFSRNFGKEAAIYAGLQHVTGDITGIIDADLQQKPSLLLEAVQLLQQDAQLDCISYYQTGLDKGKNKNGRKLFYWFINKLGDVHLQPGASDFRVFRRNITDALLRMPEYYRFSKGLFPWVGFTTKYVPYKAQLRNAGESKFSFAKLFAYAIEGIVAFSTFPLRIATVLGMIISVLAFLYMFMVIFEKLVFSIDIPGYPTIISLVLLSGGVQLSILGIIGEYIAKMYIQGKNRPIYIAKEIIKN